MLLGSVEIKNERPLTEGQESESNGDELEHSAVDFTEVVGDEEMARMVSDAVLDILASVAINVSDDENNVVIDVMKKAIKQPTIQSTPRLQSCGVNLAGRCAREHPGQGKQILWVKHTTKVDQQGKIISLLNLGMVEDVVIGVKMAMKN